MGRYDEAHKRAVKLGAPSARELVDKVPGLKALLTAKNMDQIQLVIDAAMANPGLIAEADEAYRKSEIGRVGGPGGRVQVVRDPAKERQADRLAAKIVRTDDRDRHIRIDYTKMLSADALTPRSNNPDEANYLGVVRNTLESKGVWLRLGQPYVRDTEDRSRHKLDPKVWELWFSLGYDGDTIPSTDATLDRDELLGTTMLGAGYYEAVHTGRVKTTLEKLRKRIWSEYEDGWAEHIRLVKRHQDALVGVAEISDWVGGAVLPSTKIWDAPLEFLKKGHEASIAGDVILARNLYIIAAVKMMSCAAQLEEYATKSGEGAAKVVKVLRVLKTAGEVAEWGLLIFGVGVGLKLSRAGGKGVVNLAEHEALTEAEKKLVADYIEKAGKTTVEVVKTPGYGRTTLGNRKGGHSSGIPKPW